jgi:cytochrome c peroxidase
MGGRLQSTERIEAVQDWLDTLSPPAPRRRGDEPAVQRGKAAFDAVGCAACHAGSNLTNAASVDMRASFAVQVPTLRAVGSRPPYMHDGRAKTLHDAVLDMLAFSTGGANATDQDIDDIVAYLESL